MRGFGPAAALRPLQYNSVATGRARGVHAKRTRKVTMILRVYPTPLFESGILRVAAKLVTGV